jgi:SAM-dependent methyltransferase
VAVELNASPIDRTAPWRPLGAALLDYHRGDTDAEIVIGSEIWEDEVTPVAAFYRPLVEPLPELERRALDLCRGRVLDLGAGAGRHALDLQRAGHSVVAVDLLPEAVEIMHERGVAEVLRGDLHTLGDLTVQRFDTVLMLMHGLGSVGDLRGLGRLLESLPARLADKGRLICDSADLAAVLGEEAPESLEELRTPGRYIGEVEFTLSYRGHQGPAYPWLFADPAALAALAGAAGFDCRIEARGERSAFLAVVTRSSP